MNEVRFFFKTKKFKIMLSVFLVLLIVSVSFAATGGIASPWESVWGVVSEPFHKMFIGINNGIKDYNTKLNGNEELIKQVEELQRENDELRSQLVELEQTEKENKFYKEFLDIKEKNPDYIFEDASIIARDTSDIYGSFTINKGALDGISVHDPVITSAGLVGYISEVAPSYSKVTTILDPTIKAGGQDRRSFDVGVINGNMSLALDGYTAFNNLPRNSGITADDFIVTSGGSVFPEGLIVGTVVELRQQQKDTSLYAVVKPVVEFNEIREVMVITYFSGQGIILPSEED